MRDSAMILRRIDHVLRPIANVLPVERPISPGVRAEMVSISGVRVEFTVMSEGPYWHYSRADSSWRDPIGQNAGLIGAVPINRVREPSSQDLRRIPHRPGRGIEPSLRYHLCDQDVFRSSRTSTSSTVLIDGLHITFRW
jgi:hypothetical protein